MIPPKNTKNYVAIKGEKWRRAVGFSANYYVSNMGRILTLTGYGIKNNPMIMKPAQCMDKRRNRLGYFRTVMDRRNIRVHRVVAEAWVDNPEGKPFVNHINGDRADNRAANLEWCTNSENVRHAYRTGLAHGVRGEKQHSAKLTEEQVRQFKKEWWGERRMTRKQYAKEFGVSEAAIKDIIRGRSWAWLKTT